MAMFISGKILLLTAAAVAASTVSLPAQNAAAVDRLYVFGDSYSDSGNGYALTRKPQTPPYDSRFSNGPTAVEYMANALGFALRHSEDANVSADASLNFAVSGAWTSSKNNDAAMDGKTGLLNQVSGFEQRLRGGKIRFNADTALFFIAIGTNDVLFGNIGGQDNKTLVMGALQNVEKALRSLHAAGARHIALATIPTVSLTPRAVSLGATKTEAVREAVLSLNQGYQQMAGRLRTNLKADVFAVAWGLYYDELISNSPAFGIASATSCITRTAAGETVCPDPHQFVFWDALHPTTAAHKVVGYRLASQGWPHFTCPATVKMGAKSEKPSCQFLSAANGVFEQASLATTTTCTRLAFRQTSDMCNNCTAPPWNGEVNRTSGDDWTASFVDGHNRPGSTRWRQTSQSSSEIVLYDAGRDLYTRFDLAARKGAQRRGASGNWITTSEILSIDCH